MLWEGNMETEKKKTAAPRLISVILAVAICYILIKYAVGVILPFAVAYLVAALISPLVCVLSEKLRLPKRLTAAVLVLLILLLIGFAAYLGISRLYEEIAGLVRRIESRDESLIAPINGLFSKIRDFFSRFRFFEAIEEASGIEDVGKKISAAIFDSAYSLLSRIPESLASLIGKAPRLFIGFFVTVMACYYFVCDREKIKEGMRTFLPRRAFDTVSKYALRAQNALGKYARGYLFLMLITFIESFLGLLFLGVRYSFLLALLIAAVDVLPVLGAGTVLLPWAAVSFFMRDYRLALGLIILYGVMTIIRQLIEPKIIGKSLGLHPIVSLFSMYAGLCLFGVMGMILGPAVSLMVKTYLSETAEPVNQ